MKTSVTATAAVTAAMAALALSACGQSGASDSSTASAAASVSQAPASKGSVAASSDGMMALLPMGSLIIQVPADAVTGTTTTYDDGMQQTYYDSRGSVPLTVAVERYAAGTKPAASMLAAEQQALAAQSIQPTVTPTEVPGGTGGNRLDWQTTAIPPWLQRFPSPARESSLTGRLATATECMSSRIPRFQKVKTACRPSSPLWR